MKVKLKYMGKPIKAYCKHEKDCWTFTTDNKEIVVASSNLPITPPVGQTPVEIRNVSKRTYNTVYVHIHEANAVEMFRVIAPRKYYKRIKRYMRLNTGTKTALKSIIDRLPRDHTGNIPPERGGKAIEQIVTNNFRHEAVFQNGRAVLVTVTESAVIPEKVETKRVHGGMEAPLAQYVFRRNGDIWEISFEGQTLPPVRHLAGMTYIRALLSQPGKDISALDLYEIEYPPPARAVSPAKGNELSIEDRERYGTGGSHQTILDKTASADLKKAKNALKEKLTDPDFSEAQQSHIKDQIEQIDDALSKSRVASATGGVTFEDKSKKNPRQAVSKCLESAYDALADLEKGNSKNLVKHLRHAIHKGNTLRYAPGLSWKT